MSSPSTTTPPTKRVRAPRNVDKAERVVRALATVALVAGTIAAGASAAHAHCTATTKGASK